MFFATLNPAIEFPSPMAEMMSAGITYDPEATCIGKWSVRPATLLWIGPLWVFTLPPRFRPSRAVLRAAAMA